MNILQNSRTQTNNSVRTVLGQYGIEFEDSISPLDAYTMLTDHLRSVGSFPWNRSFKSTGQSAGVIDRDEMQIFSSYSYLGLSHDRRVQNSAFAACEEYGTGAHGVRFLTGNLDIHTQLERRLAELYGREDCLLFSSGYLANIGVLSGLIDRTDTIFMDQYSHISLVHGAQLSGAKIVFFKHNDVAHAKTVIARERQNGERTGNFFMIADSVFSMDGDIFDLPSFRRLCREETITLILDEAHAFGCIGGTGRGIEEHFGMQGSVDVLIGTLSKGIPSCGGFVVGSREMVDFLRLGFAAPNAFSSPLSPFNCGAAMSAIEIMISEPERLQRLHANAAILSELLVAAGFDTGLSSTPIIPLMIGSERDTIELWKYLFDRKYYTGAVVSPAVSIGKARLRISAQVDHSHEQLETFVGLLAEGRRSIGF